jgi:uncharacterized membrane protein YbhN (UPF0104 family)
MEPSADPKPRARWWPALRVAASVLILGLGVVGAINKRQQLVQAIHRIGAIRADWLLVALALEAVSLFAFAELQRVLLREGGVDVPRGAMVGIVLAANSLAKTVPLGAAVSTGWSYAQLRHRGVERVLAGWAVLMAGALSSFALFVALAVGSWVAGSDGPVASLRGLALALAAIPVAAAVLLYLRDRKPSVRAWITRQAARPHLQKGRHLGEQIRLVRPSSRGWAQASAMASLNWAADAGCLAAAIYAVGAGVPWRAILVAYGLGQLLAVLPITPGGLAVVEAGLTAILVAYGMSAGSAIASVLLYRMVSFWVVVPIGWIAYGILTAQSRETSDRWDTNQAHAST